MSNNKTSSDSSTGMSQKDSFAQKKEADFCFCCGSPNHYSMGCPHKDKPKDQWFLTKAKSMYQGGSSIQVLPTKDPGPVATGMMMIHN